jgi:hypothetical protein
MEYVQFTAVLKKAFTPTWTSLGGAALILLLFIGIASLPASVFYRAASSVIPEGIWPTDGEPYLFSRLTRMMQETPTKLRIAWIGGSTMRDALWSEISFAKEFEKASGNPTELVDLASSGQTMGLSLSLAERAACAGGADLVIFGLNAKRVRNTDLVDARPLTGHRSRDTEPTPTSWVQDFGSELRTSIALRGYIGTKLWTSLRNHHAGLKPLPRLRYLNLRYNPRLAERGGRADKGDLDKMRLSGFLDQLEGLVRSCGADVIYAITPVNPLLLTDDRFRIYADNHSRLQDYLSLRTNNLYVDFNKHIKFQRGHFHDWGHLRLERAIQVSTIVAARRVARILKMEAP